MLRPIRTFLAIFVVAGRRLWSTGWLTLASALGFVVAVGIAFSVPLYADAVYHQILMRELGLIDPRAAPLPAFSFVFKLRTFFQQPVQWADVVPTDQFMVQRVPALVDLPQTSFYRFYQTTNLRLFSLTDVNGFAQRKPLLQISVVGLSDLGAHVTLVTGKLPADVKTPDGYISVLVSKLMAERLGIQVGDRYVAFTGHEDRGAIRVPVIVSGVWDPRDRKDYYWFYRPDQLEVTLLTSDSNFAAHIGPLVGENLAEAQWLINFDGDAIRVWTVPDFLARIEHLQDTAKVNKINVDLAASPYDALLRYQRDSHALMLKLYAFSVPMLVLVLSFVILVSTLTIHGQRSEIAVLRSRGASVFQIFGITFIEAVLLAILSFGAGAVLALGIAEVMGLSRSFLVFTSGELLPVRITDSSMPFGGAAAVTVVAITVVPVFGVARHTIITYKQERARSLQPPIWQRIWLDVLLIIPAVYWTYILLKQGVIDVPLLGTTNGDPLSSPALFLVPSLMLFAATLLIIRVLPLLLRALSWVLSRFNGISLVLASRQMARSPALYATPMLLLMLTLALANFTASIASTLDRYTDESTRYSNGGDILLSDTGQRTTPVQLSGASAFGQAGSLQSDTTPDLASALLNSAANEGPRYVFVPIDEYLKVEGVSAATRVGRYPATFHLSVGGDTNGHVMGVDRSEYGAVAYWRNDFAQQPLVSLMNTLASTPDGVLLPERVMAEHALNIGDNLSVNVQFPGYSGDMNFRIVGSFKLWPSWYPNNKDEAVLMVTNLDYLFNNSGGQSPYDVWIKTKAGADPAMIVSALHVVDQGSWNSRAATTMILDEQTQPERQGLFGVLSIGFLAASIFTVLGFFLYLVLSFRTRFIELGMLRAIGLSTSQMARSLAWETALLLGIGIVGGTILGVLASRVYVPLLQVKETDAARTLPFEIVTDWSVIYGVYILFGAWFILAIAGMVVFLRRVKIFQAIKLGEAE